MGAIDIASALAASRRAVRLYPPQHPAHRTALTDLVQAVTDSVDVRPLVLNLREGRLYEGSEVLTEASPTTRALAEALEVRRVESMTFHLGFNEIDGEGLSEVLSLRPSPELQVVAELETRGVRGVTVCELEDNSSLEAEERDRRREADRALYRLALTALKNITSSLGSDTSVDPVEALRSLALLIDRVAEDPDAILALATMSGHGEAWRFHAVSVMLRSLVLGRHIGLPDKQLLALGLAGLLHDVGGVVAPADDAEATRLAHPVAGARALGALLDEDCSAMIVAYQHHMGVDGSGWPERRADQATHPYARIVAIADRYDELVRPPDGRPLRADEAVVQLMREASGGPLDPVLVRLFVQVVGVIPIGSTVRLSDLGIGIVSSPGTDALRPRLRLILGADGTELRPAADVDLVEDERAIVDLIATDVLGLQPADHL